MPPQQDKKEALQIESFGQDRKETAVPGSMQNSDATLGAKTCIGKSREHWKSKLINDLPLFFLFFPISPLSLHSSISLHSSPRPSPHIPHKSLAIPPTAQQEDAEHCKHSSRPSISLSWAGQEAQDGQLHRSWPEDNASFTLLAPVVPQWAMRRWAGGSREGRKEVLG